MRRAAVLAGILTLLPALAPNAVAPRAAHADDERPSRYAPLPEGLLALVGAPWEETLARGALPGVSSRDPETVRAARAELLLAGNAGVRVAAERLAREPLDDAPRLVLLQVLCASARPEIDEVLARAIEEARFEPRVLAANGLGAGRTPAAVGALTRLARDEMLAVRGAALRALFALESEAAVAARAALDRDPDARLRTLRLRLHRARGDASPAVRGLAQRAYASNGPVEERIEAARCLAARAIDAPEFALALVLAEFAADGLVRRTWRAALGAPRTGYDAGRERTVAAEALVALLRRPDLDAARRERLVETGVAWVARRARVRGASADEEARAVLLAALPEAGASLVGPTLARLRDPGGFDDPRAGVQMLAALPPDLSQPALGALVLEAHATRWPAVLAAVSNAVGVARRVADERVARALLDPANPADVRSDGALALRDEPGAFAVPLLVAALDDPDDAVASQASNALLGRREPQARAALVASLSDATWRAHEAGLLKDLVARADDAAYAILDGVLTRGPAPARSAVFERIRSPRSGLRGPRAVALVRRAVDDPSLGVDALQIADALCCVDGKAGVAYVREHMQGAHRDVRRVLLRDCEVVEDASARDLALEVARVTPERDEGMLGEVATVLAGHCEKDPAQTDAFWRRLLARPAGSVLRDGALRILGRGRMAHGAFGDLLRPILSDVSETSTTRGYALAALVHDPDPFPVDAAWAVAADRLENEDLRLQAAVALIGRATQSVRASARARLAEAVIEPSPVSIAIGGVAGRGASAAEAGEFLARLREALDGAYRTRPYFRGRTDADASESYRIRIDALATAIAASNDGPTLDAIAAMVFDPRLGTWSEEAVRYEAQTSIGGASALTPLVESRALDALLQDPKEGSLRLPGPPIPPEVDALVQALRAGGPEAARARIGRALAQARATGVLAVFPDLYLERVARQLRHPPDPGAERAFPAAPEAAALVEEAAERAWPPGGPVEFAVASREAQRAARAFRYADAAAAQARATSLAARSGLADVAPERWLDRGRRPPDAWSRLRATQDVYLGAAAAAEGKTAEARDAFRRALRRDPFDAEVLVLAAAVRVAADFDLDGAEADARRASLLLRRQGFARNADADRVLRALRARRAAGGEPPTASPPPTPPAPGTHESPRAPDVPDAPEDGAPPESDPPGD